MRRRRVPERVILAEIMYGLDRNRFALVPSGNSNLTNDQTLNLPEDWFPLCPAVKICALIQMGGLTRSADNYGELLPFFNMSKFQKIAKKYKKRWNFRFFELNWKTQNIVENIKQLIYEACLTLNARKKWQLMMKTNKNNAKKLVDCSKCHWIRAIWLSPTWLQDKHRKLKVEMRIPLVKTDYIQIFVDIMIGIQTIPQKSAI